MAIPDVGNASVEYPVSYVNTIVDKKATVFKLCIVHVANTGNMTVTAGHLCKHHKKVDLTIKTTH